MDCTSNLPNESQVARMQPVMCRLYEASYFLRQFDHTCGSAISGEHQFKWIAYSDAFLMALVSIEELTSSMRKDKLYASNLFRFLKVLRNFTTHHMVVSAPRQQGPRKALVSRIINLAGPTWSDPRISVERVRRSMSRLLKDQPAQRRNVQAARIYVKEYRRRMQDVGDYDGYIYLKALFHDAMEQVSNIMGMRAEL